MAYSITDLKNLFVIFSKEILLKTAMTSCGQWRHFGTLHDMKNIVISLSSETIAMRECIIGILEYTNRQRDWNITILPDPIGKTIRGLTPQFVHDAVASGVNGVITGTAISSEGFDALVSSGLPIILNNNPAGWNRPYGTNITTVHSDDIAIGKIGAQYLKSHGAFRSYGFVREPSKNFWGTYRCRGFDLELSKHGIRPHLFDSSHMTLAEWILQLPKPAAVMLSTDLLADAFMRECRKLRISVPHQVAVLGVDNDEVLCKSCNPTLSSIQPDYREMGRCMARELHRKMTAKTNCRDIFISPQGIVERMSTRSMPPAGHIIDNGLAYIREHFHEGISAADVAAHLKISQSLLRMRFRSCYGQSVQDAILELRMRSAKELLKDHTKAVSDVAHETGFSSLERMSHFFRERLGMSPSKWRASCDSEDQQTADAAQAIVHKKVTRRQARRPHSR